MTGRTAYFGVPEQGVDALKATHAILAALWAHSADLETRGSHALVGRSFLLVTAIEGGGLIAVPERCRLSLIRKLRPGEDLQRRARELESGRARRGGRPRYPRRLRLSCRPRPRGRRRRLPRSTRKQERSRCCWPRSSARHRPDRGRIAGAPFWSEAPFLTALGIPAVYFAPGDIRICHTLEERVPVEEYLDGIAALAEFIARFCGVT